MTILDILSAANTSGYSSRFRRWLAFCLKWECQLTPEGIIRGRDEKDGAGMTYAGLTERDDDLPDDPTSSWVAYTYLRKYWEKSHAEALPLAVGEVVANYALNCGTTRAARFLQSALLDYGAGSRGLTVDGIIGPKTLAAAWKVPTSQELALGIIAKGASYYRAISSDNGNQLFLKGWLNRNADLRATFCA
jgi:lysozyme family protein